MSLIDMLSTKAEELDQEKNREKKSESDLKRERLAAAKSLLKDEADGGKKEKRSSKGATPPAERRDTGSKKSPAPAPPTRDNRKKITDGGAFPGIAFHTEEDGPIGNSKKDEEKSAEKSSSDSEEKRRKREKKEQKRQEKERLAEEEEEAEQERLEAEERERELQEMEERKRAEKARKKAERKERKRKEKEEQARLEAERAQQDKEELERLEREEFEREQKEREERERLERERIEREDKEEEERERQRKEKLAAEGKADKKDEDDLDLVKGEIWEGFFEGNILDKTMSRASAAFYQELKGGVTVMLNNPYEPTPNPASGGSGRQPRIPPGGRGSQTVRGPSPSERVIGKINASQWEKQAKEAPAAPARTTAPVAVSRGNVMEKAKFLQSAKEEPEAKPKPEVQVRKLTNSGVLANLEQKLHQPPPPIASSQMNTTKQNNKPPPGRLTQSGAGVKLPAPPPASNKPGSAPASPAPGPHTSTPASAPVTPVGSPAPPPPGGAVGLAEITPLEYVTSTDTGKILVSAGSLPSLINKLVSDVDDEDNFDRDLFVNTFLVVHPLLLKSSDLFQHLKDVYSLYCNKPIIKTSKASIPPHIRTLQVINHWASSFVENFAIAEDGAVRRLFIKWVTELKLQRDNEKKDKKKKKKWKLLDLEPLLATVELVKAEAKRAREEEKATKAYLKKKKAYKEKKKMARGDAPFEPKVFSPEQVRTSIVKEYSAKELAQQLTYCDYVLFKRIRHSELFNQNWTKHKERSPNLVAMIRWFNEVSMWTMSQIVSIPDEKERTAALRKFIEIGKEMKNMNNFNGVMLILSALNNTAVRRLKANWEALPKSTRATFVALQDVLNPDENFSALRSAMKAAEPPVIPFMGLYLTQMTYIDENEDKKEGLVNFNKMTLFGKVLLELKRFQSAEFPFKPIPSVQNYLMKRIEFPDLTTSKSKRLPKGYGKMRWWDEKEVYQQSLLVKPRDENA